MYLLHLILLFLLQILPISILGLSIPPPASLLPENTLPTLQLQTSNLTARYYVECDRVSDPLTPGLNPSNCLSTVPIICTKLSQLGRATIMTRTWIWERTSIHSGCALGYYLPIEYQRDTQRLPCKEECERDIYGLIIERCAFRSQFNVGSINVESLPKNRSPGLPMTEGLSRNRHI